MSRCKSFAFVFFALLASPAMAVLPENGLYYNPNYQGLAYYIEVEGSSLVFVTYAHDKDDGKPLYYVASGSISPAEPGRSQEPLSPPPPPYEHEYPYQFNAPLYRFDPGPCVTCMLQDWHPGEHAVEVGRVHLRMADVNRVKANFIMADGSTSEVVLWRQGFGITGYDLGREDGRRLPDLRGDWVFVARDEPRAPALRFQFTEVSPPAAVSGSEALFFGLHVPSRMYFHDPLSDATLTCTAYGCALQQDGETLFLVKFQDIGMNNMLGYKGEELFSDDGKAFQYRSDDLFIGKRMVDPAPDADPTDTPPASNAALQAAAETALGQFPDAEVVELELDGANTFWEVQLAADDGRIVALQVSLDGSTVLGGPRWPGQSEADKIEWRARLAAADLDYKTALPLILAVRDGDIIELALDDWNDNTVAWEAEVLVNGTKYKVAIEAANGSVLENRVDY